MSDIRTGRIAFLTNGYDDDESIVLGNIDDGPDVGRFPDNSMVLIVCDAEPFDGYGEERWIVMTPAGQLGWVYTKELRL